MTCHWIHGFLDFRLSGFLEIWSSGSAGSTSHSLVLLFWLSYCPEWDINVYCNRYYSNCCCFSGKTMILQLQIFATSHCVSTLFTENNQNLAPISMLTGPGSTLTTYTASLFIIQKYCSKARKIRRAFYFEIWQQKLVDTKQTWIHLTQFFLLFNPLCIFSKNFKTYYRFYFLRNSIIVSFVLTLIVNHWKCYLCNQKWIVPPRNFLPQKTFSPKNFKNSCLKTLK